MSLTNGPLTNFGFLFPVVCFVVWPSFIGAVLSAIKVLSRFYECSALRSVWLDGRCDGRRLSGTVQDISNLQM